MSLIARTENLRRRCLLSMAVLLTACASPLPRQAEVLRNGSSCCSSIAEVPILGTLAATSMTVEINDQTKIFDFPQGRSHLVAVGIPRSSAERKLEVRTWHRGNSKSDEQIFCPVVTLLDGGKRLLGTVELKAMGYTRAGFIDNSRFTQVISLPDVAEYVVLHMAAESLGRELTARVAPQATLIVLSSGAYFSPGSSHVGIRCGQQGKITLQLQ